MIEYFYVTIGLAKEREKCVAIEPAYVPIEFASVGKISVTTELSKVRRNYVATEIICVETELAATESLSPTTSLEVRRSGACNWGTARTTSAQQAWQRA